MIDKTQIKPGDIVTVKVDENPPYEVTGEVYRPEHSDRLQVGPVALGGKLVEVIDHKTAPKPLPTEPGVYVSRKHADSVHEGRLYRLTKKGWSDAENPFLVREDAGYAVAKIHAESGLVRLVPEVTG